VSTENKETAFKRHDNSSSGSSRGLGRGEKKGVVYSNYWWSGFARSWQKKAVYKKGMEAARKKFGEHRSGGRREFSEATPGTGGLLSTRIKEKKLRGNTRLRLISWRSGKMTIISWRTG